MSTSILTSLQNPMVKKWRLLNKSRAERMAQGFFIAEGEHMTQEAIQNKSASMMLVAESAMEKFAHLLNTGISVQVLADHVFASLCETKSPQGILALCSYPAQITLEKLGHRIVCLNGVQDPGNVGTILRTMDAAGFTGLLIDGNTADPYSPKVLRATMGSIFRIPVLQTKQLSQTLDVLQQNDFEILAGDLMGKPFSTSEKGKKTPASLSAMKVPASPPKSKKKRPYA